MPVVTAGYNKVSAQSRRSAQGIIRNQRRGRELSHEKQEVVVTNNGISLTATLAAGVIALATVAVGTVPAEARDGQNAAAAAGVIGGLAAGAAIGAATQPRYYETRPAYGYGAYEPVREWRVIVQEDDDEECHVRTRRVYVNGVMRVRRTTVCE
jgi:hypothetical protein